MINRKQLYDTCKKAEQVFYQQKLQGEPCVFIWYDKLYIEKWIQLVPHLYCEVLWSGIAKKEEKILDEDGIEMVHTIEYETSLLKFMCKEIHTYLGKTKKIKESP